MVAPKKESLDKAQAELDEQLATLAKKRAELKEVTDKLQALQDNLTTKQGEKKVKGFVSSTCFLCSTKCSHSGVFEAPQAGMEGNRIDTLYDGSWFNEL